MHRSSLPLVVKPDFFERMVFTRWFVFQYLRKHDKVRQQDGTILRGTRGVSEVDFLYGLADALGAYAKDTDRNSSRSHKIRTMAKACIYVLDEIDDIERTAGQATFEALGTQSKSGLDLKI